MRSSPGVTKFLDCSKRHVSDPAPSCLQQEGAQLNVVFMDNDIFVFKSIARIFENEDFDYGCTISDSKAMPVRTISVLYLQMCASIWHVARRFCTSPTHCYAIIMPSMSLQACNVDASRPTAAFGLVISTGFCSVCRSTLACSL